MDTMLPAYPWSQRPSDEPLTIEEVCAALAESRGVISRAAERLKVGSLVLRKYVERSARARAVIVEMGYRRIDRAIERVDEALEDDDSRRNDWSSRYVLNSRNARDLGWGTSAEAVSHASTTINVLPTEWQDGTLIGPASRAPIIEGTLAEKPDDSGS